MIDKRIQPTNLPIMSVGVTQARKTMNSTSSLTFTGRVRSFRCAFKGLGVMIATQHNAWIHATATVIVVLVSYYFRLTQVEWCFVVLAMVAVWTCEALNTAFEFLTDVAAPEFHPLA